MIFCGNVSSVNAAEAIRLGVTVTQDINAAVSFASFAPENAQYSLRDAGAHTRTAFSLHHTATLLHRGVIVRCRQHVPEL
jgi:hypothetical protein